MFLSYNRILDLFSDLNAKANDAKENQRNFCWKKISGKFRKIFKKIIKAHDLHKLKRVPVSYVYLLGMHSVLQLMVNFDLKNKKCRHESHFVSNIHRNICFDIVIYNDDFVDLLEMKCRLKTLDFELSFFFESRSTGFIIQKLYVWKEHQVDLIFVSFQWHSTCSAHLNCSSWNFCLAWNVTYSLFYKYFNIDSYDSISSVTKSLRAVTVGTLQQIKLALAQLSKEFEICVCNRSWFLPNSKLNSLPKPYYTDSTKKHPTTVPK